MKTWRAGRKKSASARPSSAAAWSTAPAGRLKNNCTSAMTPAISRRKRKTSLSDRKQLVLLQEFDHVLIEEPRLLELAGVSGPVQGLHLAAGDELMELEGAWMGAVFAARKDDHRAIDRLKEFLGGPRRGKLREDGRQVGEGIPFGEEPGEIRSHRRSAKPSTEILEGEIPAIAETVVLVELDMR